MNNKNSNNSKWSVEISGWEDYLLAYLIYKYWFNLKLFIK
jgi:hypothetical protein